MARQRMLHPERLPLGGSLTNGVASMLGPGPRRTRFPPGQALLLMLLLAALIWFGLTMLIRWLVH